MAIGLFWSQKDGSGGLPKTPPSTRERGELGAVPARKVGSLSISAALRAPTDEKSCGWRNARCSTAHGIMTGDVFELDGGIGRRHENWNHSMIRESEQKK